MPMTCKACGSEYWITDDGAEVDGAAVGEPDKIIGAHVPDYNYADGLCIVCHIEIGRREEEKRIPEWDGEPPF